MTARAALGGVLHVSDESARLVGAMLGVVVGGLALLIEQDLHRLPPGSVGSSTWVVSTYVAWGSCSAVYMTACERIELARADPVWR